MPISARAEGHDKTPVIDYPEEVVWSRLAVTIRLRDKWLLR